MNKYHKIHALYMRDEKGKLIEGLWARPEFAVLKDIDWEFTEKVDGTNIRVHFENGEIKIGGRTDKAIMPTPLVEHLQDLFFDSVPCVMDMFGEAPVTFYGEGYGGKIQKGSKYHLTQTFVLFDIQMHDTWLEQDSVRQIADRLHVRRVPVLGHGTLSDAERIVTDGLTSHWGDFEAEGIVARPRVELSDRRGERIIAKIKGVDYRRAQ